MYINISMLCKKSDNVIMAMPTWRNNLWPFSKLGITGISLVLCILNASCYALDLVQPMDHCFTHRYINAINSTHLQFTKEVTASEYVVLGDFKSLHCCAKGYRSIEWFKDGKPYPWTSEISSLILYPEAANQTIYTRQVQLVDNGNYICVIRNDTHKKIHQIGLEVQGNLPDLPLATFRPRDQIIELDHPARLYCEGFVGKVGLPDVRSDIKWYQVFEGGQEHEVDGIQEKVSRENGQIVGSYLTIPRLQLHNYGRYLCRIQIGNDAHRLDMYALIFGYPIRAKQEQTLLLALLAAIFAVSIVLCAWYVIIWFNHKNRKNQCQAMMGTQYSSPGGL